MTVYITCPRCLGFTVREPEESNALSRRDNKTYICSECGQEEAIVDMARSEGRTIPLRQQIREARIADIIKESDNE